MYHTLCRLAVAWVPIVHSDMKSDPVTSTPKTLTPEDIERYQRARKGGQNAGGQKQGSAGQSASSQQKPIQIPTATLITALGRGEAKNKHISDCWTTATTGSSKSSIAFDRTSRNLQ